MNSPENTTEFNNIDCKNHIPAQVEKYLDFVISNSDDHLLLGCSGLTGRYWDGCVLYYSDPNLAPDIESCNGATDFLTGVTDAAFIDRNRAVIGQDGGMITFITVKKDDGDVYTIEKVSEVESHSDYVTSIKMSFDRSMVITSSNDNSILVWDNHTTSRKMSLSPAHSQKVTSVSPHIETSQLFLSSSLDGSTLLWDIRLPKPASCLFTDISNPPSSLSWVTSSNDLFVVGTVSGHLHLLDRRDTTNPLHSVREVFNRTVHRITPNPHKPNLLAVCGNETQVNVFEVSTQGLCKKYNDDRHNDFVRGLSWSSKNDKLISCGWDKQVLHHPLSVC